LFFLGYAYKTTFHFVDLYKHYSGEALKLDDKMGPLLRKARVIVCDWKGSEKPAGDTAFDWRFGGKLASSRLEDI